MRTEVAGLLDSLFRDCGCIYRFLSFVDIFNKCLVTASGAASCSTSQDQWALVLKGGLPNTTYCPKRVFLTGTIAAVRSPQLPHSCSRMNEGRPGSVPRSRLVSTSQPSPAIPPFSGPCVPGGAVSLLSPCNPGCRSKNSFRHLSEPVCGSGWTCSSHGVAEFMEHVWEKILRKYQMLQCTQLLHLLTSWLLWIMVNGAQSHSQHLSVWLVMASAPQQPDLFQLSIQSCSPCSVWAQQSVRDLLRAPGCSGENGVGAVCVSGQ